MRNSETLRKTMFEQLEGLADGSVDPATAKASASCAMAICKTVELDLRATELLKDGREMKLLRLTSDTKPANQIQHEEEDLLPEDTVDRILKGLANRLDVATIASRLDLDIADVEFVVKNGRSPTGVPNAPIEAERD